MKTHVLTIGGGNSFPKREDVLEYLQEKEVDLDYLRWGGDWKDNLQKELGDEYEVFNIKMPNRWSALYVEWKIWLEKILPLLNDNAILVGHSLGGTFLVKYLAEEEITKNILGTFIVAAPYDIKRNPHEFELPDSLDLLGEQGGKVYFYHSTDDPVVNVAEIEKYREKLPDATYRVLEDRHHFIYETFPEIIEDIKKLAP